MSTQEENWWEEDPEGLQKKLDLLKKKNRTREETEYMYSHSKSITTN